MKSLLKLLNTNFWEADNHSADIGEGHFYLNDWCRRAVVQLWQAHVLRPAIFAPMLLKQSLAPVIMHCGVKLPTDGDEVRATAAAGGEGELYGTERRALHSPRTQPGL